MLIKQINGSGMPVPYRTNKIYKFKIDGYKIKIKNPVYPVYPVKKGIVINRIQDNRGRKLILNN